jgi:hypothetical protein
MRDLEAIQRWMQGVIMNADAAPADGDELRATLTRSRRLTAAQRLAVYHNAYHARLLECLREEFPILRQALGEETFDAFAFGYLVAYPSRSYTLTQLGARFARYLTETCPGEADGGTADWAAFVIDLATLEWTFGEVFDGPGVEGEALFDAAALAAVSPQQWLGTRLTPVPCLRLLRLRSPVQEYYSAARDGREPAPPAPRDTFLAVTRRDYVVRHHPLDAAEFAVLGALAEGRTVAEALQCAAGLPADDAGGVVGGWFRRWAANGFFRAALPPPAAG